MKRNDKKYKFILYDFEKNEKLGVVFPESYYKMIYFLMT